jgi:hypothetical protein
MSVEVMSLVLNHSKATGRAKIVLLGIANHQGDEGSWPSIATLARYANASERSVKRDLKDLVELGELKIDVQAAPIGGQYKTNLYWVTIDPSGVTVGANRGDKLGNQGCQVVQTGVTPSGTQNIINHIEPLSKKKGFDADWKPSAELTKWANQVNPDLDVTDAVAQMVDYLLATGKASAVKDIDARFRTWVRNSVKFGKPQKKEVTEFVPFIGKRL